MNLNNFVVDRIVRAIGKSEGEVLFAINQVTNASLNVTSETAEAVDAMGAPVAIFNRAKTCEFSAENALFDLNLMAVQAGEDKEGNGSKIVGAIVPAFDELEVKDGSATLKNSPVKVKDENGTEVQIVNIYELNGDGSFGAKVAFSADGQTEGGITITDKAVSGLSSDKKYVAVYEYESTSAIGVINSATKFPKACELVLEVLGCNVCNQEELIYAYLIFPNFKISPDFDWSIATVNFFHAAYVQ